MFKAASIAVALFVFAGLANAQIPSGNVFLGFSYERTGSSELSSGVVASAVSSPNLHGWEASFEGKLVPFLGIVGDVSGHYGSQRFVEAVPTPTGGGAGPITVSVTGHEQEYLVGPRLSVPVGKFTPFGEAMIGVAHIHTGGTLPSLSNTSFAYALGGGLDYRLFGPLAARVEGDYLRTGFFSSTQNDFRLSVGGVFRF
jgi:opacity protein-like surface antigen